jgi:hypothetical protein
MKKWILNCLLGAYSLGTCPAVYAGEIADLHKKIAGTTEPNFDKLRSHEEVSNQKHGITEIGLERTNCKWSCPAYTVVIKSDGTVRYKGDKSAKKIGEHTGKVSVWRFNELAQFIKDMGYIDLEDTYDGTWTDAATVYTTVVLNVNRKVIKNYANSGPTKLWAIEELIDKLRLEVKWDEAKPKE